MYQYRDFSIFLVASALVSEKFGTGKSLGTDIGKIWYQKNLVPLLLHEPPYSLESTLLAEISNERTNQPPHTHTHTHTKALVLGRCDPNALRLNSTYSAPCRTLY